MRTKYLASYHGPSYSLMDQDTLDGFTSLWGAIESVRERQVCEADTIWEYRINGDDTYQLHQVHYVKFPATTREDYMDVYYCKWNAEREGYDLGDWAYRITVGPRGGVRAEKA